MINWRDEVHPRPPSNTIEEGEEDGPTILTVNPINYDLETTDNLLLQYIGIGNLNELWINAKLSHSQTLTQEFDQKKEIPIEERVPEQYHEWLDVFNKKASD
jgi:hypothetical protein